MLILLCPALFFPSAVLSAGAERACSSSGYTVATINGVFTTEGKAIENMNALRGKLPGDYQGEALTVDYLYNPTHLAGIEDLVDSAYQKMLEGESVRDYDLGKILNDASRKIATRKLLLVGHSQGNFYANGFYDMVTRPNAFVNGTIPAGSIGVYGVATPAGKVAGGGKYITSANDKVIEALRLGGMLDILPANADIPLYSSEDESGHAFSETYVNHQSARITAEIENSLSRLSSADSGGWPCIPPPNLNLGDKIAEKIFAVVDPTAEKEKTLIVGAVKGVSVAVKGADRLSQAFADGVLAFSGFITGTANGVAGGNSAFASAIQSGMQSDSPKNSEIAQEVPLSENTFGESVPEDDFSSDFAPAGTLVSSTAIDFASIPEVPPAPSLPTGQAMDVIPSQASADNTIAESPSVPELPPSPAIRVRSGWGGRAPANETAVAKADVSVETADTVETGEEETSSGGGDDSFEESAESGDASEDTVAQNENANENAENPPEEQVAQEETGQEENQDTQPENPEPEQYFYEAKYSFGSGNGDGHDWQAWIFNGSSAYDWSDTYVNGYLREEFKIYVGRSGTWCSQCLERGIFKNGDPRLGFVPADLSISSLEHSPQNSLIENIYDVAIQWDAGGYSYAISHGGVADSSGHTEVGEVNENTWVGWDGSFNGFRTFPSGSWIGSADDVPPGFSGGEGMVLVPYPVYVPSLIPPPPQFISLPESGSMAGKGVDPAEGNAYSSIFTFGAVYKDPGNAPPSRFSVQIEKSATGAVIEDASLQPSGGLFIHKGSYEAGEYRYFFKAIASDGTEMRFPTQEYLYFTVLPPID